MNEHIAILIVKGDRAQVLRIPLDIRDAVRLAAKAVAAAEKLYGQRNVSWTLHR